MQIGLFISRDLDPFLAAIWKGDAKTLSVLIKTKSRNLLEANQEGWLPLHESAYYGHVDCLKILLSGKKSFIDHAIPTVQSCVSCVDVYLRQHLFV